MSKIEKVVVCFVRSNAPYNAGESAGFFPEFAEKLVKAGVARYQKDVVEEKASNEAEEQKKSDADAERLARIQAAFEHEPKKRTRKGAAR